MTRPIKKFNSMAAFATDPNKNKNGRYARGTADAAKIKAGKAKGAFNELYSNTGMVLNNGNEIKRVKANPNLRDPKMMTSVADTSAVENSMKNLGPYGNKLEQYDAKPKEYPGAASEKAAEEGKKKRDEEKNKAVENAKKQEQKNIGVPTEERTGSTNLSEYESNGSEEQPQTTEENDESGEAEEESIPEPDAGMAVVETPEQKMQRDTLNRVNMERFADLLTTAMKVTGGASAGLTNGLEAAQKITMSFLNGGMLPPIGNAIATYNNAVMDIGDNVIRNTGEAFGIKDGKYNPDLAGTLKGAQYYKQKAAAQAEQAQALGRTINMLRGATGMDVNADNITDVLQNMSPEHVGKLTALITYEMNDTKMRDALSRMNAGQGTPADKVYVQSMRELNKQVSGAVKTTKKRTGNEYRLGMAELRNMQGQNKLNLKAYRFEDDEQFENDMDAAYDEINRLRSEGDDDAADRLEDQAVFTEYTRDMIRNGTIKRIGNEAIMDINAWNKIKRELLLRVNDGSASPAEERLYQKAVNVTESAKEYDKGASVQSWADNLFNKWVERTGGDRDMPFFDSFLSMTGNSKYSTRSGFNAFLNKINADPFDMPDDMRKKLFTHSNDEMKSLSGKVDLTNPSDPNYRKYVELNAAKTISGWLEEEKMLWNELDNLGLTKDAENNHVGDAFGELKKANRNMENYLPLLKHNDEALIFRSDFNDPRAIQDMIDKHKSYVDDKFHTWRADAYSALKTRAEALDNVKKLIDEAKPKTPKTVEMPETVETPETAETA